MFWAVDYILDRASMATGLEVRCPMLDRGVWELAGRLPVAAHTTYGWPKGRLRKLAADMLPAAIADRSKMGFAVPIGHWFRTSLRDALRAYLLDHDHLPAMGFDRGAIESLLAEHMRGRADHTHRLFSLLSLSMWRGWLDDRQPPRVA